MQATEDDAASDVRPPTTLGYARPPARKPFRFGGPLASLAFWAAVLALVPVFMALTGDLATDARVLFLVVPAFPIALGIASLFDSRALPSDFRRARHAVWLGGAEFVLMLAM